MDRNDNHFNCNLDTSVCENEEKELPVLASSLRVSILPTHLSFVNDAMFPINHDTGSVVSGSLVKPTCPGDDRLTECYTDVASNDPRQSRDDDALSTRSMVDETNVGVDKTSALDGIETKTDVFINSCVQSQSNSSIGNPMSGIIADSNWDLSSKAHQDFGGSPGHVSASVTLPRMGIGLTNSINAGPYHVTSTNPCRIKSQSEANFQTGITNGRSPPIAIERAAAGLARRLLSRLFPAATTITPSDHQTSSVGHHLSSGHVTVERVNTTECRVDPPLCHLASRGTPHGNSRLQLDGIDHNAEISNSTWHNWRSLKYGHCETKQRELNNLDSSKDVWFEMVTHRPMTLDRRYDQRCRHHETSFGDDTESIYPFRVGTLPSIRRGYEGRSIFAGAVRYPSVERLDSDR